MKCPNCGNEVAPDQAFCSNCGTTVSSQGQNIPPSPAYNQQPYMPAAANYNDVPPEIKKWNWGAFMFNIVWGIGNHAYLTLLCLVPFLNIIWAFVCGACGNSWAWKSGQFKSVEEFLAVQKTWNRAGIFSFIMCIVIFIPMIFIYGMLISVFLSNYNYY